MKVTFTGELNVDRLAKALNEVFDSMTQNEIDHLRKSYKQKQELQRKEKQNKNKIRAG